MSITSKRIAAVIALSATIMAVPVTAQDEEAESIAPEVTSYHCVAITGPIDADPNAAILAGEYELVQLDACTPVDDVTATAVDPFEPVVVSGKGEVTTKPFMMADGDYEIAVKVTGPRDECSYGWFYLMDIEGDGYEGDGSFEQDTIMYGVSEGPHYLEADNYEKSCRWTLRFKQFTY